VKLFITGRKLYFLTGISDSFYINTRTAGRRFFFGDLKKLFFAGTKFSAYTFSVSSEKFFP